MSETKFTPGRWAFRALRGDDGLGYIEADGYDIIHAGVSDLSREENEANAHLIAAAPEMYEALVHFIEDPTFQVAVGGNPNVVDRMLDHARAALAKARGEQP
jgi:hypothetical protein